MIKLSNLSKASMLLTCIHNQRVKRTVRLWARLMPRKHVHICHVGKLVSVAHSAA